MSFNLKSSLSMAAVAVSALTLAACAKNSGSATSSDTTQAPVASPEVKAALVDTQCPEMIGTFKNVTGDEVVYAMASVPGGVSLTAKAPDGEYTWIIDGQQHKGKIETTSTYTASCAAGVLKVAVVEGDTTTNLSFKVADETGAIHISEEANGVATTYVMTKVTASVVEATPVKEAPAEQPAAPSVDPATHNPVDQPAQVPADGPSDPGQAPPLPAESLY